MKEPGGARSVGVPTSPEAMAVGLGVLSVGAEPGNQGLPGFHGKCESATGLQSLEGFEKDQIGRARAVGRPGLIGTNVHGFGVHHDGCGQPCVGGQGGGVTAAAGHGADLIKDEGVGISHGGCGQKAGEQETEKQHGLILAGEQLGHNGIGVCAVGVEGGQCIKNSGRRSRQKSVFGFNPLRFGGFAGVSGFAFGL